MRRVEDLWSWFEYALDFANMHFDIEHPLDPWNLGEVLAQMAVYLGDLGFGALQRGLMDKAHYRKMVRRQ